MTSQFIPRPDLDSQDFASVPAQAYSVLRNDFGAIAPATLRYTDIAVVLSHASACEVLADPARYPAFPEDPARVAQVCPAVGLLRQQRDPVDGYRRDRALLSGVDLSAVRDTTITLAESLIGAFAPAGAADLVNDYALPLTCGVLGKVLGVEGMVLAATGHVIAMRCGDPAAEAVAAAELLRVMAEVASLRRLSPGDDVVSALCMEYGDNERVAHQLARIFHAAAEPTWNLLALALARAATDEGFGTTVSVRDAIDTVLYTDPPLDLLFTYPRTARLVGAHLLPEHQPLAVSLVAANTDPAVHADGADITGNRAHLAWGAGARLCPAPELALQLVTDAVERLLDVIPEYTLVDEQPSWRAGAGHRAPAALRVRFAPDRSFAPAQ